MKRLKRFVPIALVSLVLWPDSRYAGLFGSDTKVKFDRKVPSEINLSNIRRIAVVNVEHDQSDRIANTLGSTLQNTGAFEILERSQLQRLMQEHNLSVSGIIDESSASDLGAVLGVEALIYGSVNAFRVYDENTQRKLRIKTGEVTKYDKKGKAYQEDVYADIMAPATVRHGELDLTLKVVNVQTGRILAQRTKRSASETEKINHVQAQQVELPSQGDVEAYVIRSALEEFVRYITPFSVRCELVWDGDCKDRAAEDLVKAEMTAETLEYLENTTLPQALGNEKERQKKKSKDKELAAIYYDMGLLHEANGNLEKAAEMYKQAIMVAIKSPDKKAKEAKERVESQIAAWQAYNAQLPAVAGQ